MMKNKIKRFLATAMIVSTVATPIATMPVQAAQNFSDVPANAWYKSAVDYAVDQGITSGTGNGKFSPSAPVTRGQMITFLWRDADSPAWGRCGQDFDDVKPDWTADGQIGNYCYYPVSWGIDKYITAGTGNNKFSPNKMCTRAQIVTMMYRAAGMPDASNTNKFTDVPDGCFYDDAVDWAVQNGITSGTSANKFSPNVSCTRAMAVAMINRMDSVFDISSINTQSRADDTAFQNKLAEANKKAEAYNQKKAQEAKAAADKKAQETAAALGYTRYQDVAQKFGKFQYISGDYAGHNDKQHYMRLNATIQKVVGCAEAENNPTDFLAISDNCTITTYYWNQEFDCWMEKDTYTWEEFCDQAPVSYYTTAGGVKHACFRIWPGDERKTIGKNAYVSYDSQGRITHFYDGEWQ